MVGSGSGGVTMDGNDGCRRRNFNGAATSSRRQTADLVPGTFARRVTSELNHPVKISDGRVVLPGIKPMVPFLEPRD